MPIMLGTEELSAVYVGANDLDSIYAGNELVFSAYNTVEGYLPLTFTGKRQGYLRDYTINGTSVTSGVKTKQLFNKNATDTNNGYVEGARLLSDGTTANSPRSSISEYISIQSDEDYYLNISEILPSSLSSVCFYDSNKTYISGEHYGNVTELSFHSPINASYCRITFLTSAASETMLNLGSTAETYEPYGYKLEISIVGTSEPIGANYSIYIGDTKLGMNEYLNYRENKIYKYAGGVLTPTDPPVGLPRLQVFEGTNTMNGTQGLGNIILKGRIEEFEGNLWRGSFNLSSLWPTDNLFNGATASSNYFMSSEYYFPVKSGEVYNFNWTNNTAQDIRVIIREYEASGAYYDTVGNQPDLGLNLTDIYWTIPSAVKYWSVTFRQYNMSYSIDDTMVTVNRLQRVIT